MALALDGKVQSTNFFGTSQSASLTTTGGSGVIVVSLCHGNGTTASVPTATGLTFTQRGSTVVGSGGNGYNVSHFTAPYTTNFSGSITCTISGAGSTVDVVAFGISGAATASYFDSNVSLPAGAATGNVSGTTSNANDFVFCTYSTTSSDSSSTAPWTSLFTSSENFHHVMYQIVSATGTQSPTLATGGPAVGGVLDAIIQASGGTPSGTLATTEAQDTAAFAGTFADKGTLATTEATDTAAFVGTFADTGTLATTEAVDTAAFVGAFADKGSFAVTEVTDTAAFTGAFDDEGILSVTEVADTAAFAGGGIVSGALAVTEIPDTASFNGTFADQGILSVTESADTSAFTGNWGSSGTLSVTEGTDAAAFAGTFGTIFGTLSVTETSDTATFTGNSFVTGFFAASETPDVAFFTQAIGSGKWRWLDGYEAVKIQPSHNDEVRKAASVLSSLGGHARANSLTAKQRSNIASTAAKARWR